MSDTFDDILKTLAGIEQASDFSEPTTPLITGLTTPPSYIVRLLLQVISDLKHSEKEEKSVWGVRLTFQGKRFIVRDWKRSSWTIETDDPSEDSKNVAEILIRKLESAGHQMDNTLASDLRDEVEKKNFFISNSYHKLRPIYEYFRKQVESLLVEQPDVNSKIGGSDGDTSEVPQKQKLQKAFDSLAVVLNRRVGHRKEISHNAAAMITFYFSYTELILDILFAFEPFRNQTLKEFREASWADRFKSVLVVSKNPSLARIYEALLQIKRTFRDVLVHGFSDNAALLVPIPTIGLVPISYELADKAIHYDLVPIGELAIRDTMTTFDEFDAWLDKDQYAQYAVLYAQSGFEIPFEEKELAVVRSWMTSRGNFEEALRGESERRDYYDNTYW